MVDNEPKSDSQEQSQPPEDQLPSVSLYHRRGLRRKVRLDSVLHLGRQRLDEPAPFNFDATTKRLIIADKDDKLVSREHLLLKLVQVPGQYQVDVRNLSRKRSVQVDPHGKLGPEESVLLPVPLLITFEDFAVRVDLPQADAWQVKSLAHQTLAPALSDSGNLTEQTHRSLLHVSAREKLSSEQLMHWLEEMMDVLQRAAGASDFLKHAVNATERIVGLDSVTAVRFTHEGRWQVAATRDRRQLGSQVDSAARAPSNTILQQVLEQKRTIRHLPAGVDATHSLQGVRALVASPILDPHGAVIGALYGVRYGSPGQLLPQISELEATLVEVIACGAAAGIAREAEQQKAIAARVRFEQYFTPQLAQELERNPDLLDGRQADISVLFCDIVRFSAISGRIGSELTLRWISDVMEHLSLVVLEHAGVLVDYIGDELMAMWGAPKEQPDHARLACRASRDLLACKRAIDDKWLARIGEPIDFRIGISSGIASVGNTGSQKKFKYGPLGETVNLASRLQGAGKHFGVRQLISHTTAMHIAREPTTAVATEEFILRPLGTVKLVNMRQAVSIYELAEPGRDDFKNLAVRFSEVVAAIDRGDFPRAVKLAVELRQNFPNDLPSQLLSNRLQSEEAMTSECLWHFDVK